MHKCEKAYWLLMPTVKKELAIILSKNYKLNGKKIAKLLGVTNAAVSQYLKKKRGSKITLSKKAKKILQKTAKDIANKNKRVDDIICKICKEVLK